MLHLTEKELGHIRWQLALLARRKPHRFVLSRAWEILQGTVLPSIDVTLSKHPAIQQPSSTDTTSHPSNGQLAANRQSPSPGHAASRLPADPAATMPARPASATLLFRGAPARAPVRLRLARPYSTAEPLIRVSNLPAQNTGHIRVLELNRASARNAISRSLLAALRAEVDAVASQYGENSEELPARKLFGGAAGVDEKGPTRAVVLASAVDSCFCAGADLKERKGFTKEECVLPPHCPLSRVPSV